MNAERVAGDARSASSLAVPTVRQGHVLYRVHVASQPLLGVLESWREDLSLDTDSSS